MFVVLLVVVLGLLSFVAGFALATLLKASSEHPYEDAEYLSLAFALVVADELAPEDPLFQACQALDEARWFYRGQVFTPDERKAARDKLRGLERAVLEQYHRRRRIAA